MVQMVQWCTYVLYPSKVSPVVMHMNPSRKIIKVLFDITIGTMYSWKQGNHSLPNKYFSVLFVGHSTKLMDH